jgi:hypothetical protein
VSKRPILRVSDLEILALMALLSVIVGSLIPLIVGLCVVGLRRWAAIERTA